MPANQSRQAPTISLVTRLRRNLFGSVRDTVLTLVIGVAILLLARVVLNWLIFDAAPLLGGPDSCRDATGACWPFLFEKHRLILFGTYPFDQHWRPALASALLVAGVGLSMMARFQNLRLVWIWAGVGTLFLILMQGGIPGLDVVPTTRWNGLPVLLMLAIASLVLAFPVGIVLALARAQTTLPAVHSFAVVFIELMRGVPMLMVLYLGLFVLPLLLPQGVTLSPLPTTIIALIFFHGAYFAEAIRGGLQSVPRGQYEAADSQGMGYVAKTRLIVLPQALQKAMPGIMNTVLGAYKDTSLVVIIGFHDIMATAKMAFSDPDWQRYGLEAYLFVGLWYLVTCWALSAYSRRLESTN